MIRTDRLHQDHQKIAPSTRKDVQSFVSEMLKISGPGIIKQTEEAIEAFGGRRGIADKLLYVFENARPGSANQVNILRMLLNLQQIIAPYEQDALDLTQRSTEEIEELLRIKVEAAVKQAQQPALIEEKP
jgi:hypothetical protein